MRYGCGYVGARETEQTPLACPGTRVLPGERVILAQNFLKIVDVGSVESKEYRAVDCGFLFFFLIFTPHVPFPFQIYLKYLELAPFLSSSSSQKGRFCPSHSLQIPIPTVLFGSAHLEAIFLCCT